MSTVKAVVQVHKEHNGDSLKVSCDVGDWGQKQGQSPDASPEAKGLDHL